jgi:chromosome segregation ATPase
MIEWFMFGALGFFLGCLLALMLAPPLWNRAVKLTTRKLEATMPMSLSDIQADKDQLRAEFAIELRKVEVALDKSKEKAARELIEANKRRVEIQLLNAELGGVKGQLQENQNANRVLQQTIKRRLPDLDSRLKVAKKALAELETVNNELRNTVASQSEALKIARGTVHNQRADIDRLRAALESGSAAAMRGSTKSDARALAESQRLSAELSRTQEELDRARTSAQEIAFLRREMTRLASQILNVTHTQGAQAHMAVEMTQAFADYTEAEEPEEPVAAWHADHGGNGSAQEPEMAEAAAMETEAPAVEMEYSEVQAEEPFFPTDEVAYEEEEEEEAPSEPAEPKGGLAKRFAARRAKRSGKGSGGSLSDRLRGLVADSPETRT